MRRSHRITKAIRIYPQGSLNIQRWFHASLSGSSWDISHVSLLMVLEERLVSILLGSWMSVQNFSEISVKIVVMYQSGKKFLADKLCFPWSQNGVASVAKMSVLFPFYLIYFIMLSHGQLVFACVCVCVCVALWSSERLFALERLLLFIFTEEVKRGDGYSWTNNAHSHTRSYTATQTQT